MRLYEELGVDASAGAEDIRRAYRELAARFHPDRNPGDGAAYARFQAVNAAFQVLGDPERRAEYDARQAAPKTLRQLFEQPTGRRVMDLFLPRAPRAPRIGQHVVRRVDPRSEVHDGRLTLDDGEVVVVPRAFWGVGVARVEGRGGAGANGGAPGDLILINTAWSAWRSSTSKRG